MPGLYKSKRKRVDESGNLTNKVLKTEIQGPLSAFGELLMAPIEPLFQHSFKYDVLPSTYWIESILNGGVTPSVSDGLLTVSTSATTNSHSIAESRTHAIYKAGEGIDLRFTAMFSVGATGSTQIAGFLNEDCGLGFGYDGTSYGIIYRNQSGSDTWYAQSTWNVDKADGNYALPAVDPQKLNVYRITLQYLGAGMITFQMEHRDTGRFVTVHQIRYANSYTIPSLVRPSLPYILSVTNTTNNTDITASSASVGAFEQGMRTSPAGTVYTKQLEFGSSTSWLSRNAFVVEDTVNSIRAHSNVRILRIHVSTEGNAAMKWEMELNPTETTPPGGLSTRLAYRPGSDPPVEESALGFWTDGVWTHDTGVTIASGGLGKEDSQSIDMSSIPYVFTDDDRLVLFTNGANAGASVTVTFLEE
jgi:hypothetical protein